MKRIAIIAALSVFAVSAALASDLPLKAKKKAAAPVAPVVTVAPVKAAPAAAPAPAPKTNSVSIEAGPEMWANINGYNAPTDNSGVKYSGASNGDIKDWSGKIGYSHTFDGVWVVGASLSQSAFYNQSAVGGPISDSKPDAKNLSSTKAEITAAYKFKVLDSFTITPGVGLGYSWGWSKINNPSQSPGTLPTVASTCKSNYAADAAGNYDSCFDPEAYYQFTLAGDWKINSEWTWNVFNIRYRDSFQGNWNTPKVSTGVTYNVTPDDAIYVSAGLAFKNAYSHTMQVSTDYEDAANITFGYKHAF